MTTPNSPVAARLADGRAPSALSTAAARTLSTTTKTRPQSQSISPRWLLRMLPWVETTGGHYRVNRRLTYALGDGRVTMSNTGDDVWVVPPELRELPALREFDDEAGLVALADRFEQRRYAAGELIASAGERVEALVLLAHGKAEVYGGGRYGSETVQDVLAEGQILGDALLTDSTARVPATVRASTDCLVLVLTRAARAEVVERVPALREHLSRMAASPAPKRNKHGESIVDIAAGHRGEVVLPGTFVDYDLAPREYELSVAQTILRVHTRVDDLYNDPMGQVDQQLRLVVEQLREQQEHELVNNREFGLLHNCDLRQRIQSRGGPPTPGDLDELLSRRRRTEFFLAHPRVIAVFGRECTRLGVTPGTTEVAGRAVPSWRGVPLLPCDKLMISESGTSSILAFRTGEEHQGVVGLRQTDLPDEYEPGLNVRFMGIGDDAVTSYLVSAYHSAAVLTPDALGALENVEIGR